MARLKKQGSVYQGLPDDAGMVYRSIDDAIEICAKAVRRYGDAIHDLKRPADRSEVFRKPLYDKWRNANRAADKLDRRRVIFDACFTYVVLMDYLDNPVNQIAGELEEHINHKVPAIALGVFVWVSENAGAIRFE